MSEQTLGSFVFDFIANTTGLDKGLEESTKKSEALAGTIERVITLLDVLSVRMNSAALSTAKSAQEFEGLNAMHQRMAESNEDLTTSIITVIEEFREEIEVMRIVREESDKSTKEREKQKRGVDGLAKKLLAMAVAYISVNKVAGAFKGNFQGNFEIAKFTELLDINAATVKNWANILEGTGGDSSEMFETFKNISIQLGEIDVAGTGSNLLQAVNKLGVKVKDELGENLSPDEILLNFADALQTKNLDKELSLFVAGQFGIGDDVLRLLNRGRSDIESLLSEQRENQFQLTDGDTRKLLEFNKQLEDTKQTADSLFSEIGLGFLEESIVLLRAIEEIINGIRGANIPASSNETFGPGTIIDHALDRFNRFGRKLGADAAEEKRINQLMNSNPQSMINNRSGGNTSFSFGDFTIQTSESTAPGIAQDLATQIKKVIGGEFTGVSETLGDSIIG